MSGSRWWRKYPKLAQVISTISLVILRIVCWCDPDIRKITRRLEHLHLKIWKRKQSVVFNSTCLDNDLLPKYTIYIYIYNIYIYIYIYIYKRSLASMNWEFSFSYTGCHIKVKESSLPYYLPIAGGRIVGVIPFPKIFVLCEMQSVSSRIWTRVVVPISYDDIHNTTNAFLIICV